MDRDEFMELVYETFADEPDNVLANGIIEAADAYVEYEKAQLSKEGATSDTISKTETVEHLRRMLESTVPNTDYDEGYIDGIEFGISTVSTMPTIQPQSTDLIDRQAAIDALMNNVTPYGLIDDDGNIESGCKDKDVVEMLYNLPPVQPEPKEGKWEQASAQRYFTSASYIYRCSVCGENNPRNTKYCPNCGADMRGEKDG